MKNWRSIGQKLLFPPLWLMIALAVISTAALTVVFLKGIQTAVISYGIYVLSFYSLTVAVLACIKHLPGYLRHLKEQLSRNQFAGRYMTDAAFKTKVSLHGSLAINLVYAAVNAVSAIIFHTFWFAIFAAYYVTMAFMRFLLVRYVSHNEVGKNSIDEWRRSRACAYILLTVNLALSGAVLMMVYFGRGFEYRGMLIYVMAMYTFYITAAAIVDMVKYRRYHSPVMSTAKVIQLTAALISMLSLETAMLSQFGGDTSPQTHRMLIMLTGAVIGVTVTVIAVYMIVRSTKEIRKLNTCN